MLYVVLILTIVVIGGIVYLLYKTNFYWKFIGKLKWRDLQPKLHSIENIYRRINGEGKKISWFEKNVTKSVKKEFESSKEAYFDYIKFCNSKHLDIPNNHEEIHQHIDCVEDALNPNEALDKELRRKNEQYDNTYSLVCEVGEKLLEQRQDALKMIESIEDIVNSISKYPKVFETDVAEISIQKEQFKSTIEYGIEQRKVLETSAKNVGTGVAAGVAVASMAPTAAIWVATTFGTASTGTAISALSGAAATNAALAWLGGGALAVGGSGMAAGQAFLALAGPIGWGVAGTSVVISVLFAWRKKHRIQETKRDEIARIKHCIDALEKVKGKINQISLETLGLCDNLKRDITYCGKLRGLDYTNFSKEQKMILGRLINNTKSLSALLNKTVT